MTEFMISLADAEREIDEALRQINHLAKEADWLEKERAGGLRKAAEIVGRYRERLQHLRVLREEPAPQIGRLETEQMREHGWWND